MIDLTKSDIKDERFILVSENKSFKDVLYLIADAFNKKRPSVKINEFMTAVFWRLDWFFTIITGKKRLLSKSSAKSAHETTLYTSEKIKKALNFNFEEIATVVKRVSTNYSS